MCGGWLTPGERGLDDLKVGEETDAPVLAFLHLSEKAAAPARLSEATSLKEGTGG